MAQSGEKWQKTEIGEIERDRKRKKKEGNR